MSIEIRSFVTLDFEGEEIEVLATVEFDYSKGCKATHYQPAEPEDVEIVRVTDDAGNVLNLSENELTRLENLILERKHNAY